MLVNPWSIITTIGVPRNTIIIGLVLLVIAVPAWVAGYNIGSDSVICINPRGRAFPAGEGQFLPGSTFEMTCSYSKFAYQDLIFWAQFAASGNGPTDPIPAHVEVIDPSGKKVVDENYNDDNIVIYVKPELMGNYTARIESLETWEHRVTSGVPRIYYDFGNLLPLTTNAYDEVSNPVGTAAQLARFIGEPLAILGFIFLVYGAAKSRKSKD